MRRSLLCLPLVGCAPELAPATVIEHLQIVSMVAEPPEVEPYQATELTVTIADPDGVSPEVAVWLCVPFGASGRCLESELTGEAQPIFTGVRDPETHAFSVDVVPLAMEVQEIEEAMALEPFRGVLAFALACAPGACELFDRVEADTVDPVDLSDPSGLLRDVPIDQAHAAWRTLTVSRRSEVSTNLNPTVTNAPSLLQAVAGEPQDLSFGLSDANELTVSPMATVGGFSVASVPAEASALLPWVTQAEDAGKDGHVYVVVDDGLGGQAVWHGEASVR